MSCAVPVDLSVALLHQDMVDKTDRRIVTSLTLLDIHDLTRSSRTYGAKNLFIVHPSVTHRKLARKLASHWQTGGGASYNPDRKEALDILNIACDLDEVIHKIDLRTGQAPILVATSARVAGNSISFSDLRQLMTAEDRPFLILLGTGWGMHSELLQRAHYLLEPIHGSGDYNHLSVRSAGAIILDRLIGQA